MYYDSWVKERQVIVNSFILCHFNYCPLIWLFCSTTSQKNLAKVNERALRLALSDYTSSYKDLLVNAESTTIHIHFIRLLALEIYKTLNNLNPAFMKNYFLPNPLAINLRRNDVLSIPKVKTTNYRIKSIGFLGPKIWNSLPNEIKSSRNANQFKTLVKDWFFQKWMCIQRLQSISSIMQSLKLLYVSVYFSAHTIVKLTLKRYYYHCKIPKEFSKIPENAPFSNSVHQLSSRNSLIKTNSFLSYIFPVIEFLHFWLELSFLLQFLIEIRIQHHFKSKRYNPATFGIQ